MKNKHKKISIVLKVVGGENEVEVFLLLQKNNKLLTFHFIGISLKDKFNILAYQHIHADS